MKKTLICLLLIFLYSQSFAQTGSVARSSNFGDKKERLSEVTGENLGEKRATSPADSFIAMAKKLMAEGKYAEALEALRTAIRIDPMNMEAWSLYDEAVIQDYTNTMRKNKLTPVITRDIKPLFSITRIDSYMELDTLYVVGSVKNLSKGLRQKISLTAKILDKNNRELRVETGNLRLTERGLFPNESSLFEIPFKNPPKGGQTYRVEVSDYE